MSKQLLKRGNGVRATNGANYWRDGVFMGMNEFGEYLVYTYDLNGTYPYRFAEKRENYTSGEYSLYTNIKA